MRHPNRCTSRLSSPAPDGTFRRNTPLSAHTIFWDLASLLERSRPAILRLSPRRLCLLCPYNNVDQRPDAEYVDERRHLPVDKRN